MLTKSDFQQLQKVLPTKDDIRRLDARMSGLATKDDLKKLATKKDLAKVAKTVDVMAKLLDRADVDIRKRVEKIEERVGLPQL